MRFKNIYLSIYTILFNSIECYINNIKNYINI